VSDIRLIVNDLAYGGWQSISVTKSIESLAGAFSLTAAEGGADAQIEVEDECRVDIDDDTIIDGHVERREVQITADSIRVGFSGYDKAQALWANSVYLDGWTFRDANLRAFAKRLAGQFGIPVKVQPGLVLPNTAIKATVSPGESAFDALAIEAAKVGALLVSDGAGNLVITRGGTDRTVDALVEGGNILAGTSSTDGSERFRRYVVLASRPGSSESSAESLRVRAEAVDAGVLRSERIQVIRPSSAMTQAAARAHADWQSRTRAAQAEALQITVQGWRQSSGDLWTVNRLVAVDAPTLRVSGDRLISEVTYTLDNDGGELAILRLMRPDAFTPDRSAVTR